MPESFESVTGTRYLKPLWLEGGWWQPPPSENICPLSDETKGGRRNMQALARPHVCVVVGRPSWQTVTLPGHHQKKTSDGRWGKIKNWVRVYMVTGILMREKTAQYISDATAWTRWWRVLPEDNKARCDGKPVCKQGKTVMMVGDGINDAQPLSERRMWGAPLAGDDIALESRGWC